MIKTIIAIFALFIGTANASVLTTFQSIGGAYQVTQGVTAYMQVGNVQSLPLYWDETDQEYRGSLLLMPPGTHDVTLFVDDVPIQTDTVTMWTEADFPCGSTVQVPTGLQTTPLEIIDVHGAPGAYICYVPADAGIMDGSNVINNVVLKDSDYVQFSGFKFFNALERAITLKSQVHHIVIEGNEIYNWGQERNPGEGFGFAKQQHGIGTNNGNGVDFGNLIISRNFIHDPRFPSNAWGEVTATCLSTPCHPIGAKAISLENSYGNNVIRYNTITAEDGHYFFDGIGGFKNDSNQGAPGPDSDIYGNIVSGVFDDAIEAEGGGINVRLWGNIMDKTNNAFAFAGVRKGPLYAFQNVVLELNANGNFIKTDGKADGSNCGRFFVLHNTIIGRVYNGVSSTGKQLCKMVSRNNIIAAENYAYVDNNGGTPSDIDFDLHTGGLKNVEVVGPNMIKDVATYVDLAVSYEQTTDSLGYGNAEVLPNLAWVHRGAWQGTTLEFGVLAYLTPPAPPPALTAAEIQAMIDASLAALPAGMTATDVQTLIDAALLTIPPGLTVSDVQTLINAALLTLPVAPTAAEIQAMIDASITALPPLPTILTVAEVQALIDASAPSPLPFVCGAAVNGVQTNNWPCN